jgi:hypothetical protein
MLMDRQLVSHRLRAPGEDMRALVDPHVSTVNELLSGNRRLRGARADYDMQGRRLGDLTDAARQSLVAEARRYTSQYRDVPHSAADSAILLSGHQPELFHPGVWFKNFFLAELAAQRSAIGVNLLVDGDTLKSASVRVPCGSAVEPGERLVAFDRYAGEIPFEERPVLDRSLFESFGERAGETIASLVPEPLLGEYWPLAVAASRQCDRIGTALARARHQLEGRWGASTLEVPQSRLCALESFYWFAAHLLAQLPRLWDAYNEGLRQYRVANRVRSRAHPAPELGCEDDWLEAPFWVWTRADTRRRPLFVRSLNDRLVLSDRGAVEATIDLAADATAHRAVEQLASLPEKGIRIRTRATITTMFARLVLGDLFVHGIGGAKYDEWTDRMIARFFGFEPPALIVATATLRLPVARPQRDEVAIGPLHRRLRELKYHPERAICPEALTSKAARDAVAALVATKRRWVATAKTWHNARERHLAITAANEALQQHVDKCRLALEGKLADAEAAAKARKILDSREYAFCLYPERTLRGLLRELPWPPG